MSWNQNWSVFCLYFMLLIFCHLHIYKQISHKIHKYRIFYQLVRNDHKTERYTAQVIYILIRSNEMKQYAGVYLLQNYCTCFGCLLHPSSGVRQIVTAASGTGHITCQSNNLPPLDHAGRRLLFWYMIWPVPKVAVTFWCTPDDGCNRHLKHVEQFCSK